MRPISRRGSELELPAVPPSTPRAPVQAEPTAPEPVPAPAPAPSAPVQVMPEPVAQPEEPSTEELPEAAPVPSSSPRVVEQAAPSAPAPSAPLASTLGNVQRLIEQAAQAELALAQAELSVAEALAKVRRWEAVLARLQLGVLPAGFRLEFEALSVPLTEPLPEREAPAAGVSMAGTTSGRFSSSASNLSNEPREESAQSATPIDSSENAIKEGRFVEVLPTGEMRMAQPVAVEAPPAAPEPQATEAALEPAPEAHTAPRATPSAPAEEPPVSAPSSAPGATEASEPAKRTRRKRTTEASTDGATEAAPAAPKQRQFRGELAILANFLIEKVPSTASIQDAAQALQKAGLSQFNHTQLRRAHYDLRVDGRLGSKYVAPEGAAPVSSPAPVAAPVAAPEPAPVSAPSAPVPTPPPAPAPTPAAPASAASAAPELTLTAPERTIDGFVEGTVGFVVLSHLKTKRDEQIRDRGRFTPDDVASLGRPLTEEEQDDKTFNDEEAQEDLDWVSAEALQEATAKAGFTAAQLFRLLPTLAARGLIADNEDEAEPAYFYLVGLPEA
jgi:hypothetical protein